MIQRLITRDLKVFLFEKNIRENTRVWTLFSSLAIFIWRRIIIDKEVFR